MPPNEKFPRLSEQNKERLEKIIEIVIVQSRKGFPEAVREVMRGEGISDEQDIRRAMTELSRPFEAERKRIRAEAEAEADRERAEKDSERKAQHEQEATEAEAERGDYNQFDEVPEGRRGGPDDTLYEELEFEEKPKDTQDDEKEF